MRLHARDLVWCSLDADNGNGVEPICKVLPIAPSTYDTPVNRFVAGFIGSPAMNFLAGTVRDGAVETVAGVILPVPEPHAVENRRRVTYGVRPEHLTLGSDELGIAVEVSVVEPTGSETLVVGRTGGAEIQAVFHERHSLAPGVCIRVAPDLDRIHLYAPESGARIQN